MSCSTHFKFVITIDAYVGSVSQIYNNKQKDLRNLVASLSSCVNDCNVKLGGAWKQAYDLRE